MHWQNTSYFFELLLFWFYITFPLQPSGHYMYHQFNIQQFSVLSAQCMYVFVWIWEQTAIISLYSINWLVFTTETKCVYCAVRTGSLYIIQVMCFVWISEQTAIISLYGINWLVFYNQDGECLLRGTDWIFIYNSCYVFCVDLRTNSDYFLIQH